MNDSETRRHQMFVRVRDFGISHASDFAGNNLGRELFSNLTAIVEEVENQASAEASSRGRVRRGSISRSQARINLREALEAISRTAAAMAGVVSGIEGSFQLPPINDELLLNAARAFVTDATPLREQFIAHAMPERFLEDLNDDIADMEAAMGEQATGVGHHVAASAGIDDAVERGVQTVRRLDAIVKNIFANDPTVLAEWTSASHTERAPRSKAPITPQPPTPSADAGSTPPPA